MDSQSIAQVSNLILRGPDKDLDVFWILSRKRVEVAVCVRYQALYQVSLSSASTASQGQPQPSGRLTCQSTHEFISGHQLSTVQFQAVVHRFGRCRKNSAEIQVGWTTEAPRGKDFFEHLQHILCNRKPEALLVGATWNSHFKSVCKSQGPIVTLCSQHSARL